MAISSECPGCGRRVAVNESLLGKKVRCKGCGDIFVARDTSAKEDRGQLLAEKPAPALARGPAPALKKSGRDLDDDDRDERDDSDSDDFRRPRSSADSANRGLLIGLCVGGGALLIGAIVTVVLLVSGSDKKDPPSTLTASGEKAPAPGKAADVPQGAFHLPDAPPGADNPPDIPQANPNPPENPQVRPNPLERPRRGPRRPPRIPPVDLNPPPGFPPINPPAREPEETDPIKRSLKRLQSENTFTQADAARTLERTPVDAAQQAAVVQGLKSVIDNRRPFSPRKDAIRALAVWGTAAEGPYLIELLDDQDGGVKEEAIRALGKRKETRSAEALAGKLSDFFLRGHVSQALKDMGSGAEAAVLKKLTESTDQGVRIECCKILKKIGTVASQPTLINLSRDKNRILANAARDALPANKRPPVWGKDKTMRLNVKVVNPDAWPAIEAKIRALADDRNPICESYRSGDYMWVDLAPVKLRGQAFAKKIKFARVTAVHDRLIYLDSGQ